MYANTDVYNHPLFRSFKNTQDKEPSSNTDEVIKIIVASNFITEAARRPAVLIIQKNWICLVRDVMTMIIFCTYRHDCWQCRNLGCKLFRTAFQIWLIYLTRSPQQCSLELSIQMACIDYPMRSICIRNGIYYYYYYYGGEMRRNGLGLGQIGILVR